MKQTEQLNNQCILGCVMMMGGTASQDGNLAQLSKVKRIVFNYQVLYQF